MSGMMSICMRGWVGVVVHRRLGSPAGCGTSRAGSPRPCTLKTTPLCFSLPPPLTILHLTPHPAPLPAPHPIHPPPAAAQQPGWVTQPPLNNSALPESRPDSEAQGQASPRRRGCRRTRGASRARTCGRLRRRRRRICGGAAVLLLQIIVLMVRLVWEQER